MPSQRTYNYRYDTLRSWWLTDQEASEFAKNYDMAQLRKLPYIQNVARNRRMYAGRLQQQGLNPAQIASKLYEAVRNLYDRRGWVDPWAMLRSYRKEAINGGTYTPPPKPKGSHHKKKTGWSQQDVDAQRSKREQQNLTKWYDDELRRLGM